MRERVVIYQIDAILKVLEQTDKIRKKNADNKIK